MSKKDTAFISTILMLKDRFRDFDPEDSVEKNKQFKESFMVLYRYLAAVYEEDCK